MKTEQEKHELSVNYVENNYPDKVEGTFDKHQVAGAYVIGFNEGYKEAEADCNDTTCLGGWLAKFGVLRKLAEKAELYLTAEIGFIYKTADVTIYEYKNNTLGNAVFRANKYHSGNTAYRMMEFLLMAEEFIYTYSADTEANLEKKMESLRAELAATRKNLAKVRKLNATKEK
jgi:hypothetical protein